MRKLSDDRIGIVGATGLVGLELLALLAERGVAAENVVAFASERSAGATVRYGDGEISLVTLTSESVRNIARCVMATGEEVSRQWVPALLEQGATVVDNSSAWRMDPKVPLVIPEINGHLLDDAPRLVANPNCSTIILLLALDPLRRQFGLEWVRVATYQAVSGAGIRGVAELREQTNGELSGHDVPPSVFPVPSAFNVFCHESSRDAASGMCGEEIKMVRESSRIWGEPVVPVAPFCMRVPVIRAHSQVITVRLNEAASRDQLRTALANAAGVELYEDFAGGRFPTPRLATGRDRVLVGCIRPAFYQPQGADWQLHEWSLLACGDQLRKGAALNALQILDRLAEVGRKTGGGRAKRLGLSVEVKS